MGNEDEDSGYYPVRNGLDVPLIVRMKTIAPLMSTVKGHITNPEELKAKLDLSRPGTGAAATTASAKSLAARTAMTTSSDEGSVGLEVVNNSGKPEIVIRIGMKTSSLKEVGKSIGSSGQDGDKRRLIPASASQAQQRDDSGLNRKVFDQLRTIGSTEEKVLAAVRESSAVREPSSKSLGTEGKGAQRKVAQGKTEQGMQAVETGALSKVAASEEAHQTLERFQDLLEIARD